MQIITAKEFDATIAHGYTFVDFYADWCGPCQMMGPVLEDLAQDYQGKVAFVKVNVDQNMELAGRYGITSIPNMFLFKDGEVVNEILGYHSKADIKQFIDANLG